jgi:hypothetical protein
MPTFYRVSSNGKSKNQKAGVYCAYCELNPLKKKMLIPTSYKKSIAAIDWRPCSTMHLCQQWFDLLILQGKMCCIDDVKTEPQGESQVAPYYLFCSLLLIREHTALVKSSVLL